MSNTYTKEDYARKFDHGSTESKRPEFEIDKGRITHSAAFRRLQGKTQVLGVGERDFYRTRLTHSLEVAQLGRGLCNEADTDDFKPDQDLVEAICLAHDIGHSPFGHFGEKVLHRLVNEAVSAKARSAEEDAKGKDAPTVDIQQIRRSGGFGANPQNLRIVTLIEPKFDQGGLDLTRATLDGLTKYTTPFDPDTNNTSKCFYQQDQSLFDWIKEGVIEKSRKPVEGQIADWADQVTYSINDIEDVIRAGLLSFYDMRSKSVDLSDAATQSFRGARIERTGSEPKEYPEILSKGAISKMADRWEADFAKPALIRERKTKLKEWTSATIKDLKEGCKIVVEDNGETSIRYRARFEVSERAEAHSIVLKKVAGLLVFQDPRVTTLEEKGRLVIQNLFLGFLRDTKLLPLDFQQMIESGDFGSKERLVADFVSGMTDRYAYSYYSRLTQPGSGSFYEFV